MPFLKQVAKVGKIRVSLISDDDITPFSGKLQIQLLDANSIEVGIQNYDLLNQITPTQLNALTNLLNNFRARAVTESF